MNPKKTVQRMDKRRISAVFQQNNSLFLLTAFFVFGLLVGVLYLKTKNEGGENCAAPFEEMYQGISNGFLSAFLHAFLGQLPFIAAAFLAGTCMAGAVLVPAVVFLRGASWGLVMGFAYATYGLIGIVFNLFILLPAAVLGGLALLLAGREAFGFSLSLARLAMPHLSPPNIEQDFKHYCLRQLFVLLFFVASALIEAVMAAAFLSFFPF